MPAALGEHLTLPVAHSQTLHTNSSHFSLCSRRPYKSVYFHWSSLAHTATVQAVRPLRYAHNYIYAHPHACSLVACFGIGNCFRRSDPAVVINGCDQVLRQNKHSKALIKGNRCMGYRFMSPSAAQ